LVCIEVVRREWPIIGWLTKGQTGCILPNLQPLQGIASEIGSKIRVFSEIFDSVRHEIVSICHLRSFHRRSGENIFKAL